MVAELSRREEQVESWSLLVANSVQLGLDGSLGPSEQVSTPFCHVSVGRSLAGFEFGNIDRDCILFTVLSSETYLIRTKTLRRPTASCGCKGSTVGHTPAKLQAISTN
jgi:hypothetical protein